MRMLSMFSWVCRFCSTSTARSSEQLHGRLFLLYTEWMQFPRSQKRLPIAAVGRELLQLIRWNWGQECTWIRPIKFHKSLRFFGCKLHPRIYPRTALLPLTTTSLFYDGLREAVFRWNVSYKPRAARQLYVKPRPKAKHHWLMDKDGT